MADQKITELGENTTPVSTDLTVIVDDPGGTPATQKMTLDTLDDYLSASSKTLTNKTLTSPVIQAYGGYMPIGHTCTYASSDDPTYTFTIAGFDATTLLSPGMKIYLTDSGDQYFFVTKVVFDDPGSTITVYGGTDYDLSTGAITNPFYSTEKAPLGFPLSPLKWTVETRDTTQAFQATPTGGTWYNLGSITIVIPIGIWNVSYQVVMSGYDNDALNSYVTSTLSTANNSESDADFSGRGFVNKVSTDAAFMDIEMSFYRFKYLNLATKDTYYLNGKVDNTSTHVFFAGDAVPTIIRAVCAFL